ncbi:creatininase family protein [Bacillus sp. NTK034]|uniref:creatininase family protein n=1 Tax=Bacillus sp. NTK034 TaxID=2802176 RepID=UPI001A8E1EE8|nr:creatininase family protein [Bacillus sp. NTK034]MBN8201433.1 creatininase family protein [Bacillus sp. NTK034]
MRKNAMHHMTWKEIEEAFKKDPVVIVPLGSMEEHGPHSITGDFLASTEIAKKVAKETGALYTPTIPFGNSEYFRGYPGTISLSQQTVISVLEDICTSLTEHGITKIIFFNGHAGNGPAVDQVARKVRREKKVMVVSMDLWQMLSIEQKNEIYKEVKDPSGHGGEPLSSVMSHLFPEDMRMDLLPDTWEVKNKWEDFEIDNLAKTKLNNSKANLFLNMEEISKEGILGNPLNASSERGEKIISCIVEYGISLVKKTEKSEMLLKEKASVVK